MHALGGSPSVGEDMLLSKQVSRFRRMMGKPLMTGDLAVPFIRS
jgi:hypothetical protein